MLPLSVPIREASDLPRVQGVTDAGTFTIDDEIARLAGRLGKLLPAIETRRDRRLFRSVD
jgi:hypothetical protein